MAVSNHKFKKGGKVAHDQRETETVSGTQNIDWTKDVFEWTMSADTTASDINLPSGTDSKEIELILDGAYTFTPPAYWNGFTYDGTKTRYLVRCVNGTSGSEEVEVFKLKHSAGGSGIQNVNRGSFTAQFACDGNNGYYNDVTSGLSLSELSIAANPVKGSTETVRIPGDTSFSIPAGWNFSGRSISTIASKLNELTLLYVGSTDIRLVNRVFDNPNYVAPPTPQNSLSNLAFWFNGTDADQITVNGSNQVTGFDDKTGTYSLVKGDVGYATFDGSKITFPANSPLNRTAGSLPMLEKDVDFEGFFIFKLNASSDESFVYNTISATGGRFGIGMNAGILKVQIYDGTTALHKGVAFSDTTSLHKVRFKISGGALTAWLDEVEMTDTTAGLNGSSLDQFVLGGGRPGAGIAFDFYDFYGKTGAMSGQELTDSETYNSNEHGL